MVKDLVISERMRQKDGYIKQLQTLFKEIDEDGDGCITQEYTTRRYRASIGIGSDDRTSGRRDVWTSRRSDVRSRRPDVPDVRTSRRPDV